MILEGFEIENWSCIQRVAVTDLPPTGVVVLHGPNGTGKSSIIEALRACLMDNKSTSRALERGFPKNSSAKPRVTVHFRASGTSWKIMKHFNSKVSELHSRTAAGQWKLETADPSEAHERTRQLTGGSDSALGLHQLLWLTQAEFRLPDPKKFDPDVQSRLRAVLGVLQTPLDDRFLNRVKEEWSRWFGMRSKPGEKPKLKKDCPLDKALAVLEQQKTELAEVEAAYQAFERMIEKSGTLEVRRRDLRRQLQEKSHNRDLLQDEYEKSLKRLEAHRLAVDRVTAAEKILTEQQALRQRRADAEQRIHSTERAAETAARDVEEKRHRLQVAEQRLRELRGELQELGNTGRELQDRLNAVGERRQLLTLKEQLKIARENLQRTEQTAAELEDLKQQERRRPSPAAALLRELEENRARAASLRADLEAAAIMLTLIPAPGAPVARLALDGASPVEASPPTAGTPTRRLIRRRAEIAIPGWGRAEIARGSDARSLDQIENELNELDRCFAEGLAPFGVGAGEPTALDQLRGLAAEKKVRDPELKRKREELDRLAPNGLDPLRQEMARLEKRHQASESEPVAQSGRDGLPLEASELERLANQLKTDLKANEASKAALAQLIEELERAIEGIPEAEPPTGKRNARADRGQTTAPGLRRQEAAAVEALTTLSATAEAYRVDLKRVPTAEQIELAIQEAEESVRQTRMQLESAKLSESEATIRDRLDAANEGWRALQGQLAAVEKELHQIEGALRLSEGLHQKRAAAAARVQELAGQLERERLQSEAFDRLYALFEECREKQLGAVMGPIHDRVLRWMRLLRIGSYQSIRFNDQLLPDKLISGNGAVELALAEESTGTIEQIALMVRLALGSTLSTPAESVVALLDDPLTHSDVVRLDLMRAVLKNAAGGDAGSTPPAGPMQIVVFTCHPEWFAIDGAKLIDLSDPEVLTRSC